MRSAPIATPCNNRRTIGSGVFYQFSSGDAAERFSQRGQELLETEAEEATLLEAATRQRD
jgi:hypothetical protein